MSKGLKTILVLTVILSLGVIIGCGKDKGKTLVRVGSTSIGEGDLDLLVKVNPRLKDRLATPVGRQKIIDNYVDQSLLYQESKRRGLHKKSVVKDKISLYTRVIISQALLEEELETKIKEYYDNHQDEFERSDGTNYARVYFWPWICFSWHGLF